MKYTNVKQVAQLEELLRLSEGKLKAGQTIYIVSAVPIAQRGHDLLPEELEQLRLAYNNDTLYFMTP